MKGTDQSEATSGSNIQYNYTNTSELILGINSQYNSTKHQNRHWAPSTIVLLHNSPKSAQEGEQEGPGSTGFLNNLIFTILSSGRVYLPLSISLLTGMLNSFTFLTKSIYELCTDCRQWTSYCHYIHGKLHTDTEAVDAPLSPREWIGGHTHFCITLFSITESRARAQVS